MIKDYSSQYYKVKSKAPFAFGPLDEGKIPWITFVGYDISHLKEVRVRKSTVEKQIKKQEEVVGKVIRTVKESERPIERKKTIESVRSRLIGMSVGRIVLWEDNAIKEMCWAKGFPCLTKNPYSIRQIKRLDRSRAKQIDRLYKKLPPDIVHDKDKDNDPQDKPKGKRKHKNRPIIYYGKPFSYYYWLEKKDEESNGK